MTKLSIALDFLAKLRLFNGNIFSIISFVVSLVSLGIGFYVQIQHKNSKIGKILSLLGYSFSIWSFSVAFLLISDPEREVWFWYYLSSFGFFTFWPLIIHLFIRMLGTEHTKLDFNFNFFKRKFRIRLVKCFLLFNYLIVFSFFFCIFNGNGVPLYYKKTEFGLRDQPDMGSFLFWYYTIFLAFWFVLSVILAVRFKIKSLSTEASIDQKKQANIILVTGLVSGFSGLLFNHVFPAIPQLGIDFPAIGSNLLGIFIFGVAFAISKYNFAAEESILIGKYSFENSGEPIFVTSTSLKIVRFNRAFLRKMGYKDFDVLHLKDILLDEQDSFLEKVLQTQVDGKLIGLKARDGSAKYFNLTTAFFYNRKEIDRIHFTLTDVSTLLRETQAYSGSDVIRALQQGISASTQIRSEKKLAALFFCDIHDFTSTSERLGTEETVNLLNLFFEEVIELALQNGEINNFMGDAVFCLFEKPSDAVFTSLKILDLLKLFNRRYAERFGEISVGIGITFGNVIKGNVGAKNRKSFTAIGSYVNIASRIQGLTNYYKVTIIVSDEVRKWLPESYKLRFLDKVCVKGSDLPMAIFQIIDDQEIALLYQGMVNMYREAFIFYSHGNFSKAYDLYTQIKSIFEKKGFLDPVLEFYMSRCLNPEHVENGVYMFDTK